MPNRQKCCDVAYMHVHCKRCGQPSVDSFLCCKCFYEVRAVYKGPTYPTADNYMKLEGKA